jgi:hypothetical protein
MIYSASHGGTVQYVSGSPLAQRVMVFVFWPFGGVVLELIAAL